MATQVSFFTLGEAAKNVVEGAGSADECSGESAEKARVKHWALAYATEKFRAKRTVFIQAASQEEAEALDEALWTQEPESFVPHRLVSESPQQFAPVVIGFAPNKRSRADVFVNLAFDTTDIPDNFRQYQEIVDFVSDEERLKESARTRFRNYRQAGCQLKHQALTSVEAASSD